MIEVLNKQSNSSEINEYYPFGLQNQQTSSTQFGSKEQRVKFESKELIKDFKLESYDFGSRMYNPQIARWSVADKKAEANPAWTPYRAFYNNPMRYVDPDGNIELPASMATSHPNFYSYMKNNYANDVMGNSKIMNAMYKNSQNNLTDKQIQKAVAFGSGPKLILKDKISEGHYSHYNESTKNIEFSKEQIDKLEKILGSTLTSRDEKLKALFGVYMGLNHEITHFGDWLDGSRAVDPLTGEWIEVGDDFEDDAWRSTEVKETDGSIKLVPFKDYDKYSLLDLDEATDKKSKEIDDKRIEEIRKALGFPTLPK
jgi:RHS repeat-associated protein